MDVNKQHILLIDNNEDDYLTIHSLLTQRSANKFELKRVRTYEAALPAITGGQYDLYLIGYDLGEHSGLELLAEADRHGCRAPLILLSKENDRAVDLAAMEAGASDYLVKKQLDALKLERSIRYALERKRVAAERDHLLAAEQTQRRFIEALYDITIALNSTLDLDELLIRILANIERVVPHETADIMLLEGEQVRVVNSWGYLEHGRIPMEGISFALDDLPTLRHMVRTGQPLWIRDIIETSGWTDVPQTRWIRSYLGAPIQVRDHIFGFLSLASATPEFFEAEHAERLMAFANQAGIALNNIQLLEAERRQRELAEALQEVSVALNSTLAFDTILDQLLEQIARVIPYDSGNVMLIENDEIRTERARGYDRFGPESVQAIQSFSLKIADATNLRQLIETRKPLIISNTAAYPDWIQTEHMDHILSWVGAPIVVQGDVIAIFSLDKTEPYFYQPEHAELLTMFANLVAPALENASLFETEARRRHEAEILREATTALTSALDLDQVLETILLQLAQVVPYDSTCLFLKEREQLRAMAGRGLPNPDRIIGQCYPLEDDVFFIEMQRTQQPIHIPDAQADPRFLKWGGATYIRGWLGVPLIARGEVIGHLTLDSHQYDAYGEAEALLTQAFANQAATAIINAQLFQTAQQHVAELNAVREASLSLISTLDLPTVLETILENTLKLIAGAHNTNIFLYQDEKLIFGAALSVNGRSSKPFAEPRSDGLTYTVARQGKPIVVPDMRTHPLFEDAPPDWTGSIIGLPLKIGQRVVGVMNVADKQARSWPESELHILHLLADQAAVAIENARLFEAERTAREQAEALKEKTRRSLTQITRLYELSTEIVSALSLEEAANLVMEKVVRATGAHSAVLNLLDKDGNLELAIGPNESVPRPLGTTTTIFKTGQPLIISDVEAGSDFFPPELQEKGIRASIGLPLKAGHQIIGVIFVCFDRPRQFARQEIETLFIFANQAAIAIQNARLYERVRQDATDLQEKVVERTHELRVMYELAQALGQATKLGDVIRLILLHLYQAIPYDLAACLLATDPTCRLVIQSQYPCAATLETDIKEITLTTLNRLGNQSCQAAQVVIHAIQPSSEAPSQPLLENVESLLQVPITIDAAPIGILLIGTQQAGRLGPEQAKLLRTVADEAAESIHKLQSLLAAEHRRLENLVAQLPNGVILLDTDQHVTLANPIGQEFLNVASEATLGDTLTLLGEKPLEEILLSNSVDNPFEIKTTGSPGYIFEVTAKRIAEGPESGGWLLVIRDITAERTAQLRLQQQEQLAAVGQLAAGIAHDFNNILTSIIGYAELMQLEPELSATVRHDLERIVNQSHRAARLVRQILDFSRQSITTKHPLDLVTVIKEMIKLLERTIPENIQFTLHIEPPDKEYIITADLSQMQQVLTNLAVNARDAMPGGGTIRFQLARFKLEPGLLPPHPEISPGNWVVLSISDTGVGIPTEVQAHIFEPFFTTKETGQGTGLGLAQVYGIITEHGGYIDVDSVVDKGTIFRCYLPSGRAIIEPSPPVKPSAIPRGRGETILLVEDDIEVLNTTKAMLRGLGYQVLAAASGREALVLFEEHKMGIGLVLTDITMPDMDGIDLSKRLIQKNPNLKIIALTGYPLEADRQANRWQDGGIMDWLQKPVTLEQLGQTISRFLGLPQGE